MSAVYQLKGRELIDSRGQPALEVEVLLENGLSEAAIVPSGASTGRFEALELRDKEERFFKKGLLKAIKNVALISDVLKGMNVTRQKRIDERLIELDGSPLKSRLGANSLLAVSLACLRASAKLNKKPLYRHVRDLFETEAAADLKEAARPSAKKGRSFVLPVPLINIVNGGAHAANSLQIQEFMIVPWRFVSFKEALRAGCEIFYTLRQELLSQNLSVNVGDEGGFAPSFKSSREVLDLMTASIDKSGYTGRVALALDCAASEFYREGFYHFEGRKKTAEDMTRFYEDLARDYPVFSIEDGLAEDDWKGWSFLTEKAGGQIQIVGDDLFVTQRQRLKRGIKQKAADALLVKCNQVGTVSETFAALQEARRAGYACVMSHRSGETEDTSISDLALGWGCEQIKTGSVCRGERTAKYNRLLRIEEELGDAGSFFGPQAFARQTGRV